MPHATFVGGYRKLQSMGYQVRRGERGCQILVPIHGQAVEEIDPYTDEPIIHHPVRGFTVAYVWDVSQCQGPPVPNFKHDLGHDARPVLDAAVALATRRGIEVEFRTPMAPTNGISLLGKVVINSARPVGVQASTALHQLAHEAMHPRESRVPSNRSLHEGEAEGCAWAALQGLGVAGTMLNAASYIRSHRAEPRDLLASLERITAAAHDLVTGLDRHLPPEFRAHPPLPR